MNLQTETKQAAIEILQNFIKKIESDEIEILSLKDEIPDVIQVLSESSGYYFKDFPYNNKTLEIKYVNRKDM